MNAGGGEEAKAVKRVQNRNPGLSLFFLISFFTTSVLLHTSCLTFLLSRTLDHYERQRQEVLSY